MNRHDTATFGPWPLLRSPYYWLFCLTYVIIFYLNNTFLIPRYFITKKYFHYATALVLLLTAVYFIRPFDKLLSHNRHEWPGEANEHRMPPPETISPDAERRYTEGFPPPHSHKPLPDFGPGRHNGPGGSMNRYRIDMVSLFIYFMIVALSIAVSSVQQWHATEQKVRKAEADKASAELSFLKAQINPHFLFNTLNNIYTLAVTNSGYTAASIMKLSNLMRYVTDDVTADFVPLQSEADCISDYIDLQRLRIGSKNQVNFKITGDPGPHKIPPLIFMTFVENVFKYGVSKQEPGTIDIELAVETHLISFFCRNRLFERSGNTARTGIGIKNVRQRLEYLYPQKHVLTIDSDNGFFTVKLMLQT